MGTDKQSGVKNLQAGIGSVGESSATTVNTHGDTANQIAESHSDATPEECIPRIVVALGVDLALGHRVELRGVDDRHDDAVNSHDFAENDGNQVLGSDSGCSNTTTNDRGACEEDTPARKGTTGLA